MIPIKQSLLLFLLLFIKVDAFAQCDSLALAPDSLQWVFCDSVVGPSPTNGYINVIKKFDDTLYIGGKFKFAGKYTGSFIAVDTTNGSLVAQPTWPKVNGEVTFSIPDGSGGIFIGGTFSKVGDSVRGNFAQINAAGQVTSLNFNFQLGSGAFLSSKGIVTCAVVYNGILYVGGSFVTVNSTARNRLVAINLSTKTITSWNPGVGGMYVNAMVTDGTNLYVAGDISSIGSIPKNNLGSIVLSTGTVNTWGPNANPTSNGGIYAMDYSDGYLYFLYKYLSTVNRVGTTSSVIQSSSIANNQLRAIKVIDDKIYVGGYFTNIGGQNRNRIAALDTATFTVKSWNPNIGGGSVHDIKYNNGLFVAGDFNYVGGVSKRYLAKIDTATGLASSLSILINPASIIKTVLPIGTSVFIGGDFATVNGKYRNNLAAINLKSNEISNWDNTTNGEVFDILIDSGSIYFAGWFSTINGLSRQGVAKMNITNNVLANWNPLNGTTATAYVLYNHGADIFVGGNLSVYGTINHYGIIKTDKINGIIDNWAPATFNIGEVRDIKISGNNLYLAGNLATTTNSNCLLIKHNLVSGLSSFITGTPTGSYQSNAVHLLDNKVYIGGTITNVSGFTRTNIAAFDTSSLALLSFDPYQFSASIMDIKTFKNKLLISTSSITTKSPVITRTGIAIVDSSSGNFVGPFNPKVSSTIEMGKTLIVGDTIFSSGAISSVNDKKIFGLTRYHIGYPVASVSISTPTLNPCVGASVTITANSTNASSFQWVKNGTVVSGVTSNTYTFVPSAGDSVVCIATSTTPCILSGTTIKSNPVVFGTPNTNTTAIATISANPSTSVCSGSSVTYTCTTNVTGGTYQWKVGTINVGTNSNTYTYIPSNGNFISCQVTKSANTCFLPSPVISDTIIAAVTTNVTPTASVSASVSGTICSGSSVTYTCGTNITGGSYQWKIGTTNVGSNSNIYTYTPANGDVITCEVTKPAGACYTQSVITSSPITISVAPNSTPTASISASVSGVVCSGSLVTYTCSTNVTGGSYQWKVGTTNVGTSSNTYTYTPANGDIITCEVTKSSGTCYIPSTVTSNSIVASVTANTTSNATITASTSTSVCSGSFVTYTCSTNVTGASYQWKVGTSNVGINSNSYTYAPVNGDVITCEVTKPSNACFSPATVISNNIIASVVSNTTPTISISASAVNICPGKSDTFTATTNILGATLQWKVNGTNVGTNSTTYIYSPANSDVVTCMLTTPAGCYSPTNITSNALTITYIVPTTAVISIISSPSDTVCIGTTVSYTASTNFISPNYQWRVNNINVGSNSSIYSYIPISNDKIECIASSAIGCYNSPSATSNKITMIVNAKQIPTISISGPSSASSSNLVTINATLSNTGSSGYTIDWSVNGSYVSSSSGTVFTFTKGAGSESVTALLKPNGCYNNASSNIHVVTNNLSVTNQNGQSTIVVYPNPFEKFIRISSTYEIKDVILYDVLGKEIIHKIFTNQLNNDCEISTCDLARGSYRLNIYDKNMNILKSVNINKQ